ncbi:MAG TPA: TauD/TfdA family dioxygenase [Candidatus Polarisedimenticolia bacterium]|nr:TauD/TfdA family dioxygenase [Candidatus Polarisedimenticolia bacterium]
MKEMEIQPIAGRFGAVLRGGGTLSDLDDKRLIALFKEKGALLFAGFESDLAGFERFSNRFSSDWMLYEGGAHERRVLNPDGDGTIYSVNFYFGKQQQVMFELPVHADMSYIKHSPLCLFFYCVQPARMGGETAVVDGEAVYAGLGDATRRLFAERRIKYIRKYYEGGWQLRFGTSDLDEVRRFCDHNEMTLAIEKTAEGLTLTTEYAVTATPETRWGGRAFRNSILPVVWQEEQGKDNSLVRFEDGAPLPPDVIAEVKAVTKANRNLIPLHKTEILWVDNSRVLHGRMTFDDPARDVAIRMAASLSW